MSPWPTRLPGHGAAPAQQEPAADPARSAAEAAPIVALVDLLVAQAVHQRASDIHLERIGTGMRVRARVVASTVRPSRGGSRWQVEDLADAQTTSLTGTL